MVFESLVYLHKPRGKISTEYINLAVKLAVSINAGRSVFYIYI